MGPLGNDVQFPADTLYHCHENVATINDEHNYSFSRVHFSCSWAILNNLQGLASTACKVPVFGALWCTTVLLLGVSLYAYGQT